MSYAEYHSKRNPVERVHAAENEVLSRHGAFSNNEIHSSPETGKILLLLKKFVQIVWIQKVL